MRNVLVSVSYGGGILQVATDRSPFDPARFFTVAGAAAAAVDAYLGFLAGDPGADAPFTEEDAPVRIDRPLAVAWLGRRYLNDHGVDLPITDAALHLSIGGGRLLVADLDDLP